MPESGFTEKYLAEVEAIAARMVPEKIDQMVLLFREVRARGGRLFFLGNGGGAGYASHAAADFRKTAGIESYSPSDNIAELTARVNDDGWAGAYADWLRGSHLGRKDAIFLFSVGGGSVTEEISVNLVNCLKLAREVGAKIAGIVGRNGGYAAEVGDAVLIVPATAPELVTALTESFQAVVWHAIVSHPELKVAEMKWESGR